MAGEPTCLKCNKRMQEGFVIDEGYGWRTANRWFEGAPERSMWVGVKTGGKRALAVQTYRCAACGYLES